MRQLSQEWPGGVYSVHYAMLRFPVLSSSFQKTPLVLTL